MFIRLYLTGSLSCMRDIVVQMLVVHYRQEVRWPWGGCLEPWSDSVHSC